MVRGDRLRWRYRRNQQVLYVTADYVVPEGEFVLAWSEPDGVSHIRRSPALAHLYDQLEILERQLGADGWELLPLEQRAANRLRTPVCATCVLTKRVDVVARTATHVEFRCLGCGHTWVVPKPGPPASTDEHVVSGSTPHVTRGHSD